jgi:hypothetical protein
MEKASMTATAEKAPIEATAVETKPARSVGRVPIVRDSSPAGMIAYAMQTNASIAELRELYALKKEWEADEARKAYNLAMTAFKAEDMEILKRKRVGYETKDGDWVGYSHAELSDITEVVGPAMAKHELSFSWDVRQENGIVHVDCIVRHAQGHTEKVSMFGNPDSSGKKNGIQQIASTVTYLQRYTLLAVTGMATKGMDDDGRGSEPPAGDAVAAAEPDPERERMVADLFAAADEGSEKIAKAWKEMTPTQRARIGPAAWQEAKTRAEQADRKAA